MKRNTLGLWLRRTGAMLLAAVVMMAALSAGFRAAPRALADALTPEEAAEAGQSADARPIHLFVVVSDMQGKDKLLGSEDARHYYAQALINLAADLSDAGRLSGVSIRTLQNKEGRMKFSAADGSAAMAAGLWAFMERAQTSGDNVISKNTWESIRDAVYMAEQDGVQPVILLLFGEDLNNSSPLKQREGFDDLPAKAQEFGAEIFWLWQESSNGRSPDLKNLEKGLGLELNLPAENGAALFAVSSGAALDDPAALAGDLTAQLLGEGAAHTPVVMKRDADALAELAAVEAVTRSGALCGDLILRNADAGLDFVLLGVEGARNGSSTTPNAQVVALEELPGDRAVVALSHENLTAQQESTEASGDAPAQNDGLFGVVTSEDGETAAEQSETVAQQDEAAMEQDEAASQQDLAADQPNEPAQQDEAAQDGDTTVQQDEYALAEDVPLELDTPNLLAAFTAAENDEVRLTWALVRDDRAARAQEAVDALLQTLRAAAQFRLDDDGNTLRVTFDGVPADALSGGELVTLEFVDGGDLLLQSSLVDAVALANGVTAGDVQPGSYSARLTVRFQGAEASCALGESVSVNNKVPQVIVEEADRDLGAFLWTGADQALFTDRVAGYFTDGDDDPLTVTIQGVALVGEPAVDGVMLVPDESQSVTMRPVPEGTEISGGDGSAVILAAAPADIPLTLLAGETVGEARCVITARDDYDGSTPVTLTVRTEALEALILDADGAPAEGQCTETLRKGETGEVTLSKSLPALEALNNADAAREALEGVQLTARFAPNDGSDAGFEVPMPGEALEGGRQWRGQFIAPTDLARDYTVQVMLGEQILGEALTLRVENAAPALVDGAKTALEESRRKLGGEGQIEIDLKDYVTTEPNDVLTVAVTGASVSEEDGQTVLTLSGEAAGEFAWAGETPCPLTLRIVDLDTLGSASGEFTLTVQDQEGEACAVPFTYRVTNRAQTAVVLVVAVVLLALVLVALAVLWGIYTVNKTRGLRLMVTLTDGYGECSGVANAQRWKGNRVSVSQLMFLAKMPPQTVLDEGMLENIQIYAESKGKRRGRFGVEAPGEALAHIAEKDGKSVRGGLTGCSAITLSGEGGKITLRVAPKNPRQKA